MFGWFFDSLPCLIWRSEYLFLLPSLDPGIQSLTLARPSPSQFIFASQPSSSSSVVPRRRRPHPSPSPSLALLSPSQTLRLRPWLPLSPSRSLSPSASSVALAAVVPCRHLPRRPRPSSSSSLAALVVVGPVLRRPQILELEYSNFALMAMIAIHKPGLMTPACYGARNHQNRQRISVKFINSAINPKSSQGIKNKDLSIQLQKNSVSQLQTTSQSQTRLHFDRLQPTEADQVTVQDKKHEYGQFVVREAMLDEEYWTAAWLRAETHWEDRDDRYADSYKRKFTEHEFNMLKRQRETKLGQKSACIVTVKKIHGSERHTIVKSVVGTLDVSIRPFLHGETFPGERVKAPIFYSTERKGPKKRYGYIANVCVAKSARRQGIARNMLYFAIQSALADGAEQVYVHVHRKNIAAQEMYQKMGFEVVDLASPQLSGDKTYLLCYRAQN